MRVVEVTDRDGLAAHRAAWETLRAGADGGDFFQSFEWLQPWVDTYWSAGGLAFLFVYEGDDLVAVGPFARDDAGSVHCAGALATPVNPHVRRQGILYRGDVERPLTAMVEHLKANGRGCRIVFKQLVADEPLARALPSLAGRLGFRTLPWTETSSSLADLSAGWDAYVASRKRQVVREIKRKWRKLDQEGGWAVQIHADGSDWREGFAAVVAVEERSWKHPQGTSIANEPGARAFYEEVARLSAERGWLTVYVLTRGGVPVAHVMGVADRGRFLALKTAYDQEHQKSAPGAVLMWRAVEDAARRGCTAFDFLGDSAPWKSSFGTLEQEHVSLCFFPKLRPGCEVCRATEIGLKPCGRRLGVDRLVHRLRAFRDQRPAPPAP